jgi:hypothetical protein
VTRLEFKSRHSRSVSVDLDPRIAHVKSASSQPLSAQAPQLLFPREARGLRTERCLTGSAAFVSATCSPRNSQVRNAASVRKPAGETYTNPFTGLPVKSIGRTTTAHDGGDFLCRDSYHKIAAHNAAAHAPTAEECQATKHLASGDVVANAERRADAVRKRLVVCHGPFFPYWLHRRLQELDRVRGCVAFAACH